MKGPLSGGLTLSISDGWWPEAADGQNGWTIDGKSEGLAAKLRDAADAQALYELLEQDIVPLFYATEANGAPRQWIQTALRSAATVNTTFSSHRMVAEYLEWGYRAAHLGHS
jgi:starch phosphorylase